MTSDNKFLLEDLHPFSKPFFMSILDKVLEVKDNPDALLALRKKRFRLFWSTIISIRKSHGRDYTRISYSVYKDNLDHFINWYHPQNIYLDLGMSNL